MLQLYDVNKVKVEGLTKYKNYKIESILDTGDKTLSFSYPSILSDNILEECYIRNETDEFVIKETKDDGKWKSVVAVMNVENLEGQAWADFETINESIEKCLTLALAGTGWTVKTISNIGKKRTVRKTNCSSWDLIQEAKKVYRVEVEFDTINKIVKVYDKLGSKKGTYFIDSLNLKELNVESNSYDYFTKIIALGKDDIRVELVNNQYSNKIKALIWKDEKYTDVESLIEDARLKLNEISKPYKSYRASIIDLSSVSDRYKDILDYKLGDTIVLISKDLRIKEEQRIVKIIQYPDNPISNECEMANTTLSFKELQKEFKDTTSTVNNITEDNGKISEKAIKEAVDKITIDKVNTESLNAAEARIGTLESTTVKTTDLTAITANIESLQSDKANITDLTATNIKFNIGSGGTLDLQTLLAKFVTVENGQYLNLTTDNLVIDDAVAKDIIAKNISVADLKAGNIDANRFNIVGSNGNLVIKDNTIQIKDNTRVRVQIGKDTSNDYSMYVWDKAGNLMFDATGLKEDGIKNKIIRDDMVADNANISGEKINIRSLITEINKDNTQTLKASKIAFDSTGQSLEVSFNSLKSNVDSKESRNLIRNSVNFKDFSYWEKIGNVEIVNSNIVITGAATSTTFIMQKVYSIPKNTKYTVSVDVLLKDIMLGTGGKIWVQLIYRHSNGSTNIGTETYDLTESKKYVFTQKSLDVDYGLIELLIGITNSTGTITVKSIKAEKGENPNPIWTPAPEDVEEKVEANTTAINAVQGKIETLIKETSIEKDGKNIKLKDAYSILEQTVSGVKSVVVENKTSIAEVNSLADSKAKVFTSTPTTPYKIGDIWVSGPSGDIMKCKVSRKSGSYVATDWEKASKYTDDTKVNAVEGNLNTLSGKVSKVESNYTNLSQDLNGFKTNVSNTYSTKTELSTLDGKVSSIGSRVKNTESSITQLSDKIAIKVEATEVNTIANNIMNKNKQLVSFRYIRDWLNGSTANVGNHWTEIQVFSGGANIAKEKVATGSATLTNASKLTDGVIDSTYVTCESGWQWVQIDLGSIRTDIDMIKVWHYYLDGRAYNHKLEVSRDGVTWRELFNSDVNGTYKETIDGRTYLLNETAVDKSISTTNTKVAEIQTSLTDITSKVSSTESSVAKINGNLESLQNRMSTAENKITSNAIVSTVRNSTAYMNDLSAKANQSALNTTNNNVSNLITKVNTVEQSITATAITTTISSSINSGSSSISTTKFVMDKKGLTINNGALTVRNNNNVVCIDGNYNMFKIYLTGIINVRFDSSQTISTSASAQIYHNLGYPPAFQCYVEGSNGYIFDFPYIEYVNQSGAFHGLGTYGRTWSNNSLLEIAFKRPNDLGGSSRTIKVRYYIFKEVAI